MFRGFIFLILFSLMGCKWLMGPDEELTLECKPFVDNRLRVDGYYYYYNDRDSSSSSSYFFYKNGVVRSFGGFSLLELNETERLFSDSSFINRWNNRKYYWGLFKVNESEITIEMWHPRNGPLIVLRKRGTILSDTSFLITDITRLDNTERESSEKIYLFKRFRPKPDSVSKFLCNENEN